MKSAKTVAIIPAAGSGLRMGSTGPKQYLELAGRPILALTLDRFNSCPLIDSIILVVPLDDIDSCMKDIVEKYNLHKVDKVIAGGSRRQDSVRLGVNASNGEFEIVVIHDGVRPFVQTDLIEKSIKAMENNRAVITAMPAKDTVKKVGEGGLVLKTYERKLLWLVQTPQVFRYEDIRKAHQTAVMEGWDESTDDALLLEKIGIPVKVIMGSEINIKITTPYDMELARFLASRGT
jgi:2-C-methyl-D-erythritol 4-phosphate cytidylyltransferase